ncbi:unnamed protein product [Boreogadus saida]
MPPKLKNRNNPAPTQMRPTPQATSSLGSSEAAPPRAPAKPSTPEKTAAVSNMSSSDFKAELLAALRDEVVGIFKAELEAALKNNFAQIKSELQSVKVELNANMAAIRSEVDVLKVTVTDMEGSLSTCTDDVLSLQSVLHSVDWRYAMEALWLWLVDIGGIRPPPPLPWAAWPEGLGPGCHNQYTTPPHQNTTTPVDQGPVSRKHL